MKKAIIQLEDRYVNIPADRLIQDGDYLYVYRGEDELVGMVRWALIVEAHISDNGGDTVASGR